ncbi:hypothetical protein OG943_32465 [Amycolatopsis sp. NBC_00345]|uniref:hypothetical protein n=1 Tax=Amycolatopsis sp. NBC_00345 TaxID=2975955 RepID=UPI003246C7B5
MQVRVRHQPSFAVARSTPAQGGIMKGLGRAFLGGESFFSSSRPVSHAPARS